MNGRLHGGGVRIYSPGPGVYARGLVWKTITRSLHHEGRDAGAHGTAAWRAGRGSDASRPDMEAERWKTTELQDIEQKVTGRISAPVNMGSSDHQDSLNFGEQISCWLRFKTRVSAKTLFGSVLQFLWLGL